MVRISDFQIKDVVNISDGKKLGNITDLDVNLDTGRIDNLIIGVSSRIMGIFGKEQEISISWRNIVKIGEDVILVRFKEEEQVTQQLNALKKD